MNVYVWTYMYEYTGWLVINEKSLAQRQNGLNWEEKSSIILQWFAMINELLTYENS